MAYYACSNGLIVNGGRVADGRVTVQTRATTAGVEAWAEDVAGRVLWRGRDAVVTFTPEKVIEVTTSRRTATVA